MLVIDPKTTPIPQFHQYLLGSVAPRPIAFASTLDFEGRPNLAPYSFFNVFSSNPPICVFSSNRRVTDNTTKDTLRNVIETGEVVINIVNFSIVRQMALASVEYPEGVNEFSETGLTPIPSELVKPFRVKESPVHLECKVQQVIPLGQQGGAGHLIICEILRLHIDEKVLDEEGRINPHKMDLVGRMGGPFYVRASGEALHVIQQPTNRIGIGFLNLPQSVRTSEVLSGNNLGQLASITAAPEMTAVLSLKGAPYIQAAFQDPNPIHALHKLAQLELAKENIDLAAKIAWLADTLK